MDCGVCANAFDHRNLPLTLQCGHEICAMCLEKLIVKVCPYDRIPIMRVEVNNWLRTEVIEKRVHEGILSESKLSDFCPKFHLLKLTDARSSTVVCNSCKGIVAMSSWHCLACNFDLCHHCKGEILCCSDHIMTTMPPDPYKCDGCLKFFNTNSRSCRICDIDLCSGCCTKYQKLQKKTSFCEKGHKMKWLKNIHKICELELNHSYYTCQKCLKKFHKSGAFSCLMCRISTCLTCS